MACMFGLNPLKSDVVAQVGRPSQNVLEVRIDLRLCVIRRIESTRIQPLFECQCAVATGCMVTLAHGLEHLQVALRRVQRTPPF